MVEPPAGNQFEDIQYEDIQVEAVNVNFWSLKGVGRRWHGFMRYLLFVVKKLRDFYWKDAHPVKVQYNQMSNATL